MSLRNRLAAIPGLTEYGTADAERVFIGWLRERADLYLDSPIPSERQIRYELLSMAVDIEAGTA